jgi:hypothetical protein
MTLDPKTTSISIDLDFVIFCHLYFECCHIKRDLDSLAKSSIEHDEVGTYTRKYTRGQQESKNDEHIDRAVIEGLESFHNHTHCNAYGKTMQMEK